jgi:hypothetical protein
MSVLSQLKRDILRCSILFFCGRNFDEHISPDQSLAGLNAGDQNIVLLG